MLLKNAPKLPTQSAVLINYNFNNITLFIIVIVSLEIVTVLFKYRLSKYNHNAVDTFNFSSLIHNNELGFIPIRYQLNKFNFLPFTLSVFTM